MAVNQIGMVQALREAGFTGGQLRTMTAIGLAESGGNQTVINNNPNTGDYSVGWFQVNYFGSLMSGRSQQYGSPASLANNPLGQGMAAFSISGGGRNFTPWTTYTSGRYLSQLPRADALIAQSNGNALANSLLTQPNGSGGTVDLTGAQNASSTTSDSPCADCLICIPIPGVNIPVPGIPSVQSGGICLLSKGQGRALIGGLLVASGGLIVGLGLILVMGKKLPSIPMMPSGPTAALMREQRLAATG